MKKHTLILAAGAFAIGLCNFATYAQSSNGVPATPVSFFNSVAGYFTSHNPDLTNTFNAVSESWAGADYQNQVNVSSSVGLELNVIRKPTFNLALESVTRLAGIGGTIVSEQAGIKPKFIFGGDTELGVFIEGGYRPQIGASTFSGLQDPFAAIGVDLKKALTTHTFAGLRFEEDVTFKKGPGGKGFFGASQPVVSALAGFTF